MTKYYVYVQNNSAEEFVRLNQPYNSVREAAQAMADLACELWVAQVQTPAFYIACAEV